MSDIAARDAEMSDTPENGSAPFDPGRYLTKIGSSDYLEVKWRLVWLREVHPTALIDTELVSHTDQMAIFKATVSLLNGGSATGYGSESYDDFTDYIEKAETKALGRALAALGFGTQFCPDFEFGAADGAVVDSPIDYASTRGRRMESSREYQSGEDRGRRGNGARGQNAQDPTPRQVKFLTAIIEDLDWSIEEADEEAQGLYGKRVGELNRQETSTFIEALQRKR